MPHRGWMSAKSGTDELAEINQNQELIAGPVVPRPAKLMRN